MATTFPCYGRIHVQNTSDKASSRSTRPCCTVLAMEMYALHDAPGMVDLHISAGSVDVHGACTTFDRSEDPRHMNRARVA